MFITRQLFLYGTIATTLTATAQEMFERHEARSVSVLETDGGRMTTMVDNMDTVIVIQTNATAEAALLLDPLAGENLIDAGMRTGSSAHPAVVRMPALCQVVVPVERVAPTGQGAPKAEVFRYRYKQKPTTVPVHSTVDDTVDETGVDDGVEKAAGQQAGGSAAGDLRVLPNPSAGVFTLAFPLPDAGGTGELYITDAAGRVVHREALMGQGGQARVVDLTGKGNGTYVATVVLGDRSISKRLVIE